MEPLSNFSLNTNQNEISQIKQKVTKIEAICDIFWHSQIQGVEYFGQLGQDIIAYMMLKNVKNGFYCDIAAHNGKDINNTLLFERLGWMGFCVEANPKTFKELRKNRKCDCYNVAVMSKPMGKLRFATTTCDVLDCVELNYKYKIYSYSIRNISCIYSNF